MKVSKKRSNMPVSNWQSDRQVAKENDDYLRVLLLLLLSDDEYHLVTVATPVFPGSIV